MNYFSIGWLHVMKVDFVQWPTMAISAIGQRRGYKALPEAKLALKKRSSSLFGGLLPFDSIQLYESWQNYYIWEVCSAKQWDTLKTAMLAASTGQQNGPNPPWNAQLHITQPTHQNLNELDYEVLLHPQYLPDLSPTDNHFKYLDNFLQEKHSHNQQEAECFARAHWLLKHRFLCYRNKQTYFSLAKNVLIVMVLILINKDMFEPSYNDNSWFKPQLFLYQPNNNISLGEDVE